MVSESSGICLLLVLRYNAEDVRYAPTTLTMSGVQRMPVLRGWGKSDLVSEWAWAWAWAIPRCVGVLCVEKNARAQRSALGADE